MEEVSSEQRSQERPLSPHLQIYRLHVNMVMSILHRITGVGLYFGSLLLAWWLFAAAAGPEYFAFVNGLFATWIGIIVLVGCTWALIHHMIGGVRHFVWDSGSGLDIPTVDLLSWGTIVLSAILTVCLWIYVAVGRGWL